MKRFLSVVVCLCLFFTMIGCARKNDIKNTIQGNIKTYYEMSDGTWLCDNVSYAHRVEIKGRLNNAVCDTVYVYLSNKSEMSFEEAWKASGLSSNTDDYYSIEEAVLVELSSE